MNAFQLWLHRLLRGHDGGVGGVLGRNTWIAAITSVAYALLVRLSFETQVPEIDDAVVLWLADGFIVALLLIARFAHWPTILLSMIVSETVYMTIRNPDIAFVIPATYTLIASLKCSTLAVLSLRVVPILRDWRDRPITGLRYLLLSLIVPVPFAFATAFLFVQFGVGESLLTDAQVLAAGDALGFLLVTPLMLAFALPRTVFRPVYGAGPLESTLALVSSIAVAFLAFAQPPEAPTTLLDLPYVVFPFLVWTAIRCHPRVLNVALVSVAMIAMLCTVHCRGPFAYHDFDPGAVIYSAQAFLLVLALTTQGLVIATVNQRVTSAQMRESDRRYKSFIANSSEAIWRVDMVPSIDLSKDRATIVREITERAVIRECNLVYFAAMGREDVRLASERPWRDDQLWFGMMMEHIDDALQDAFAVRGLEVRMPLENGALIDLLVGFRGVIVSGRLRRLWGTATDVTEIRRVNRELQDQRTQLRRVMSEWVLEEDRKRAELVESLTSDVGKDIEEIARRQRELLDAYEETSAAPGALQRIGRLCERVTKRMARLLERLDPSELAQKGLRAALQAEFDRTNASGRLKVDLRCGDWVKRLSAAMSVLTYRIVVELVRDAETRAEVDSVRVTVDRPGMSLRVRVAEYERVANASVARTARLSERVRAVGGMIRMERRSEEGITLVTVEIPLDQGARTGAVHG